METCVTKTNWPERYPVAYILSYLQVDPASPSGLSWRNSPNHWIEKGGTAGSRSQAGWIITLLGGSFKCDHVVLMLSGSFPRKGQFVRHLNGNKFDNSVSNLQWTSHSNKLYRASLANGVSKSEASCQRELDNEAVIREWIELDDSSPTGLRWKKSKRRVRAGTQAGTISSKGVYKVVLESISYSAPRLVLLLSGHPPEPGKVVDHINGDQNDNRASNLRWITREELGKKNGSMTNPRYRHVYWIDGKFVARYKIQTSSSKRPEVVFVGEFDNPQEARDAVVKHRLKHLGHE